MSSMFLFRRFVWISLNALFLYGIGVQAYCVSDWVKMNDHNICFQGSGDHFGSFRNYVRSGLVAAIKLEHVSGHIACATGQAYNSYWGCANHKGLAPNPFNAVVTDQHNQVIFPKTNQIGYAPSIWYRVPFADTTSSKEIVFTDFAQPFYFPKYKQMRIWYGEDLKGITESDNHGRVCVNVYAKFML
ncbi:uncharacterized protein LOC116307667 [Actinia tenebrosa]|uniref:Uncharacterized protein LOC116307667 n=1 Tax=Actinia tenebrosa TaxID=6105 RepID=A0A6P8J2L5_ACTTE|nr:uncharacterized protein LOC116307667 [Actinia tenebrosa]